MKYQNHASSCGAAALANALRMWGDIQAEEKVQELAGTTGAGTGAKGLRKAAKKLGYRTHEISDLGMLWAPTVLLVDGGEHWVAAVALVTGYYLVVDSAAGVGMRQTELTMVMQEIDLLYRTGSKPYGITVTQK